MKKLNIYVALVVILLCSCAKEQVPNELDNPTPKAEQSELSSIASMLTDIGIDMAISNEVHQAALKSLGYGQDENWRFIEIMDPKNSILTKSAPESKLKSAIEGYYSENNLTKSGAEAEGLDLLNSNVHIYWPYSESWDGEETPAITFAPADDSQLWNYGYKRRITASGEVIIDTIKVDEEYSMKNPVWIINYSERPYEDLPNFAEGEITKNGITFLTGNGDLSEPERQNIEQSMSYGGKYTSNVRLGYLYARENFDSFWQGGSEFNFRMTTNDKPAVGPSWSVPNIVGWELFRSRHWISNGTPYYLSDSNVMIQNWIISPTQNRGETQTILFYEWDGDGTYTKMSRSGTYGTGSPWAYIFNIWTGDDFIKTQQINPGISTTVEFDAKGVYWKFDADVWKY